MFKTIKARFALRGFLQMVLAVSAVAGTIWIDNPYVKLVSAGAGALAAYLGIGYISPQVEPFIGVKYDSAEVPAEANTVEV